MKYSVEALEDDLAVIINEPSTVLKNSFVENELRAN